MTKPWKGAAIQMPLLAFKEAAEKIGCDEATLRAVWEVEAAGRGFRSDRSLERRFEPHHMPGSKMTWRDSLNIGRDAREELFEQAFLDHPTASLRATSWGAPQIMGFNHSAAGYATARQMVEAMAKYEREHLEAFVFLVQEWGLDAALRGRDWLAFARRYNGSGQPEVYARRMEAAYRRHSGAASPVVLRVGDRGPHVARLQQALGIEDDGAFGPATLRAVQEFQARRDLPVDGVVGARTWAALKADVGVTPPATETPTTSAGKTSARIGAEIGAVASAIGAVQAVVGDTPLTSFLPESWLPYVIVGALLAAGLWWGPTVWGKLQNRWAK